MLRQWQSVNIRNIKKLAMVQTPVFWQELVFNRAFQVVQVV